MWREMKDVMGALSSCYEELLKTSEEKHRALAAMNLKEIERVVKEEERLVLNSWRSGVKQCSNPLRRKRQA